MLIECEYTLPVIPNEDGTEPRGDAAIGVNGKISPEYNEAITNYCQKYHITDTKEFINHIKNKVIYGKVERSNELL